MTNEELYGKGTYMKELQSLIDQARREGKFLRCTYGALLFTPDELEAQNQKGSYVWGAVNWFLVDPLEILAQLERDVTKAQEAVTRFKNRIHNSSLKRSRQA